MQALEIIYVQSNKIKLKKSRTYQLLKKTDKTRPAAPAPKKKVLYVVMAEKKKERNKVINHYIRSFPLFLFGSSALAPNTRKFLDSTA